MGRANRRRQGGRESGSKDIAAAPGRGTTWHGWYGAALLAWIALVYAPSLANGFTYDDPLVVADASRLLSDPSLIGRLFSLDYFRLSGESTYRPMVTLTYIADWQIAGGAPWAFHLQNVLWHLVAVGALLRLLKQMGAGDRFRYTAAMLYGVHPAVTEAVYAIGFREDVLVTAFGLTGLVLLTGDRPRPTIVRLLLGAASLAAALFSKESAVVFLVLVPLTTWALSEGRASASWAPTRHRLELVVVGLTTAAYLIVRFVLLPAHESYGNRIGDSIVASLATGAVAVGYYLRLLVYPVTLCADYRGVVPWVTSVSDWRLWLSLTAIAGLTYVTWRVRRPQPLALWGWTWFLAALGPVSNVVPIPAFMAERFLHLPFVGLLVWAVALGQSVMASRRVNASVAGGAVVLAVLLSSVATWHRHRAWESDETLWRVTLRDHPTAHGALHGYGSVMIAQGRFADGVAYLRQLLDDQTIPKDRRAAVSLELGAAYDKLGQVDAARRSYEQSIAAAPDPRARLGLAMLYFRLDRLDEARAQLETLVREQPDSAQGYGVLGGVLSRQGHRSDALAAWSRSIALDPSMASSHANIGVALGNLGRVDEGIAALQKAIALEPQQVAWYVAMARLLAERGQVEEAARSLQAALRIDPGFAPARDALRSLSAR